MPARWRLSPATAVHEIRVFKHAFTKAVEWGLVSRHPFKGEVGLKGPKPRTRYVEDWEIKAGNQVWSRRRRRLQPRGQVGWNMVLSIATGYYEKVMTTLTVKIPEALERSIAIAARRERVTKSELVRRAMAKYVAQTGEDRTFQSAMDLAGDLIGSVRGGPVDLATNAKYMDDYGK